MLSLLIQIVCVLYLFMVPFFEKSVNATNTSKDGNLDFQVVIEENSKYPPVKDKCALRIVGGTLADIEEIPYQTVLRNGGKYKGKEHWFLFCGGSLITQQHVITAAHCFDVANLENTRVVAGATLSNIKLERKREKLETRQEHPEYTEVWRKILTCFLHPLYDAKKLNHDFAVLKLETPFNLSRTVQPIPMLKPSHGIRLKENGICLVSGFGTMERSTPSKYLRMVCVPIVSRKKCEKFYGTETVTNNQFCAGEWGKDSCHGDSGGPITYNGYLIGIVSYGGVCGETPGVYTMISTYTTGDKIHFVTLPNLCVMPSLNILTIAFVVFIMFLPTLFH